LGTHWTPDFNDYSDDRQIPDAAGIMAAIDNVVRLDADGAPGWALDDYDEERAVWVNALHSFFTRFAPDPQLSGYFGFNGDEVHTVATMKAVNFDVNEGSGASAVRRLEGILLCWWFAARFRQGRWPVELLPPPEFHGWVCSDCREKSAQTGKSVHISSEGSNASEVSSGNIAGDASGALNNTTDTGALDNPTHGDTSGPNLKALPSFVDLFNEESDGNDDDDDTDAAAEAERKRAVRREARKRKARRKKAAKQGLIVTGWDKDEVGRPKVSHR
jgi:hypothetical protein